VWPIIDQLYGYYKFVHGRCKRRKIGKYAFSEDFFGPFKDYDLSWWMDFVSQEVWGLYKQASKLFGLELFGFDTLAGALKERAIEIQIGPSRELYYTMPSP
jgi:hypothetical protein